MGARVARERAASRSAKKRASASPAPAEGNPSAPVNKKKVSALTVVITEAEPNPLTNFKVVPTRKTRSAGQNPSAETAPLTTPETAPDDDTEDIPRPERRSREGFTAILTQIVEEAEFDEADKSIGNYECRDSEWESWKAGPAGYGDEYEASFGSASDSDEAQSVATAATNTRFTKPPLASERHASITKLTKLQTKATRTGGSKRKHQDLDVDSNGDTEPDSEPEVEGVCAVLSCWLDTVCADSDLLTVAMGRFHIPG